VIDPISALEGLQSAIAVVKKAAKIANDLGGLAGVVGKLFDARSQATKAMTCGIRLKQEQQRWIEMMP